MVKLDEIEDDSGTAMQTFANEEGISPLSVLGIAEKSNELVA